MTTFLKFTKDSHSTFYREAWLPCNTWPNNNAFFVPDTCSFEIPTIVSKDMFYQCIISVVGNWL